MTTTLGQWLGRGVFLVALSGCTTLLGIETDYTRDDTVGLGGDGPGEGGAGASASTTGGAGGGDGGAPAQGGDGGAGGSVEEDCGCESITIGDDKPCLECKCVDGSPDLVDIVGGNLARVQTAGDCLKTICDANAEPLTTFDNADVVPDADDCTNDQCEAGQPLRPFFDEGTVCSTGFCTAAGSCVECLSGTDCTSGLCQGDACVVESCGNDVVDGNETDKNCGGIDCGPCATGQTCSVSTDCFSQNCSGTCVAPSCTDGIPNGEETDLDCGGTECGATCGADKVCLYGTDCLSQVCTGNRCVPTCYDNEQNQDESAIDCGGVCAAVGQACGEGQACNGADDCFSLSCKSNVCNAPNCWDSVTNGDESGKDCGGSCDDCVAGEGCRSREDCISRVCGTSGTCSAPTCSDLEQNGSEVGVDCGGSCSTSDSKKCPDQTACNVGGDCISGQCVGNLCYSASCSNGAKDGAETDLNCGGGTCPACGDTKSCVVNLDCTSLKCTATVCTAPSCSDGVKNPLEADVDCGQVCPSKCVATKKCVNGADCNSGVCEQNVCKVPTCFDGVKNGSETDIDCGGNQCGKCNVNKLCSQASDCKTSYCSAGFCGCPSNMTESPAGSGTCVCSDGYFDCYTTTDGCETKMVALDASGQISGDPGNSYEPSIAASPTSGYAAVWMDDRNGTTSVVALASRIDSSGVTTTGDVEFTKFLPTSMDMLTTGNGFGIAITTDPSDPSGPPAGILGYGLHDADLSPEATDIPFSTMMGLSSVAVADTGDSTAMVFSQDNVGYILTTKGGAETALNASKLTTVSELDVAAGNAVFGAVWLEMDAIGVSQAVMFQEFGEDGAALAVPSVIHTNGVGRIGRPRLAYYPPTASWVVVWSVYGGTWNIRARFIGTTTDIDVASSSSIDESDPVIAAGASDEGFRIVWVETTGTSARKLFQQRINASGKPIGGKLRVMKDTVWPYNPEIAWSEAEQEYGLVWVDYPSSQAEIMFNRLAQCPL